MTAPIYSYRLRSLAWRLHWWVIANMDDRHELTGSWRANAARALGVHRTNIHTAVEALADAGLIEREKGKKLARVVTANIVG